MSERETIRVKATDVVVLRVDHTQDQDFAIAQRIHEETGALVLILPVRVLELELLPDEEARCLFDVLKQRFEEA